MGDPAINGPAIAQVVRDRYDAEHNNLCFQRFSTALEAYVAGTEHRRMLNLLVSSAYERMGLTLYHGASKNLAESLLPLCEDHLLILAEAYLRVFTVQDGDLDNLITLKLVQDADRLRTLSQNALTLAGDHHRWRGRVAFYWLNAVNLFLTATIAVLQGEGGSYVREKFMCAVRALGNGVAEAAEYGLLLGLQLAAWFNNAPRQ